MILFFRPRIWDTAPMRLAILLGSIGLFLVPPLLAPQADEADVVAVRAYPLENGTWRFDVTVSHADEGWNHYASGWEILGPDGRSIAQRVLRHPHVEGNPFTRSLPAVRIPAGIEEVTVRAQDKVHGYGGTERMVDLTKRPAVGIPVESSSPQEESPSGRPADGSAATGPISCRQARGTHQASAGPESHDRDPRPHSRSSAPMERTS